MGREWERVYSIAISRFIYYGDGLLLKIYRDAQLKWDVQWYIYSQLYIMGINYFLYRDYEGADRIKGGRGVMGKGGDIRNILSAQIARRSEKGEETRGGWGR